ncbi:MAG: alpha/beta fold hydrolase [Acidobacteriota bacterium]
MSLSPRPRPFRRLAALSAAALLSAGCLTIGTATTAPEKQAEALKASALTRSEMSAASEQVLRQALLEDVARDEPTRAIRALVALYDRSWGPSGVLAPATAAAELAVAEGRRLESSAPVEAAGYYLAAADLAQDAVVRALGGDISPLSPRLRFSAELYNFSTSRLTLIARDLIFSEAPPFGWPNRYAVDIESPIGVYRVELGGDLSLWNPRIFGLRPADEIEVRGLDNRHRNRGLGAALVLNRLELPTRSVTENGFYSSFWNFYALTAVARFEDLPAATSDRPGLSRKASLLLHDPLQSEEVEFAGTSVPLEADHTAPLAVLAEIVGPSLRNEGDAALNAERYLDEAGIYLIEPYRRDKVPLLLVHGLNSSVFTWLQMANDIRGDPVLRERYQVWAFNYPTGLPFSISAALLRQSFESMLAHFDPEGDDEAIRQMVMVGHSMGGLLTRAQATAAGTALWDAVATRPFEEAELEPDDEALLRRAYLPEPMPELSRAVFIAAPHRGSRLAAGGLGRLASSLVKIPAALAAQFARLTGLGILQLPEDVEAPDVVDSLSADSPILQAYEGLPITVPFHTIVGDRNPSDDLVTDGFVPFDSSRLEGAESELVIKDVGHNVHKHPAAIAEVRRILLEHLCEQECYGD